MTAVTDTELINTSISHVLKNLQAP